MTFLITGSFLLHVLHHRSVRSQMGRRDVDKHARLCAMHLEKKFWPGSRRIVAPPACTHNGRAESRGSEAGKQDGVAVLLAAAPAGGLPMHSLAVGCNPFTSHVGISSVSLERPREDLSFP